MHDQDEFQNDETNANPLPESVNQAGDSAADELLEAGTLESNKPESGTPISDPEASATLSAALARWQVVIPDEAIAKLEQYCQLLWEQNKTLNLTRHTTYDLFVTRDLVDTLNLAQHLNPDEDVLDIGSGGGVPGIPLAILRPDLQVCLAESVGRKARALNRVIADLEIPVTVFEDRAEKLLDDLRFDVGVARAVGSLSKMAQWFRGNWTNLGRLLAVKGPKWVDERTEAEAAGLLKRLQIKVAQQYPVPGQEWESVILKVWPKGNREK